MNQDGQAMRAYPEALPFFATGEQSRSFFRGPTLKAGLGHICRGPFTLSFFDQSFIEAYCLSLFDAQRSSGANAQAEPGAIAQFLAQHSGLAIHHLYRTLGAGYDA